MRMVSNNMFIPDRSRPGSTTAAIGAVQQGADGNYATAVGRRKRGGKRVKEKRERGLGKSMEMRIGTLNVGTMTGKGRELADMMERRKLDVLCVQETKWKGSKARNIGGGYKLYYHGTDGKRNGVGIVLKEKLTENVLEVKRVTDRLMGLKVEVEGVMLNVVCAYAPQVGCEMEEKDRFWQDMDGIVENLPREEQVIIGADFNGHVGEGNCGDEKVLGKHGFKQRNEEGQMIVDFAKRMELGVINTYFRKKDEHKITYKSGGRSTQVDYMMCWRRNLKKINDCKVVVSEGVVRQHRLVMCKMELRVKRKRREKLEPRIRWWKLKQDICQDEFREEVRQMLGERVRLPEEWEGTAELLRVAGKKVLGVSSGKRKVDKETWWWNNKVQEIIKQKREAKKGWDLKRDEDSRRVYKESRRLAKKEVAKAKEKAYEELYDRLETKEGEKELYRLAKQRDRAGKDVQQVRLMKDENGNVLTNPEDVLERWKKYFEKLMNEENDRERTENVGPVNEEVESISKEEVKSALRKMKCGKAVGPDELPAEVWKCLRDLGIEFLSRLFNKLVAGERMPEEWRKSELVPIYKNKGDAQCCGNYRGIKFMSHTMKMWERVVEARLRDKVEIGEQQFGFMPGKSTTDAIFALRLLMEKYREGQQQLHCVFVDLEKAYDRVPREVLWNCMRQSGVAERYVNMVQDMYEGSMTKVRCAMGVTKDFKVKVGLHQGSALSPFLFAVIMDRLTDEIRRDLPWTMMFADDIVICDKTKEEAEGSLERWRHALERRGMKVSRAKTEYLCVNGNEGEMMKMQGHEVARVDEFKYLGSTVQENGDSGKEVKKRVQAGWNGWRKISGVLCDRKLSARIKGKIYRTIVRSALMYGLETVALTKKQEKELEVAELRMLRFALGVTRMDKIKNEYIRGSAQVVQLGEIVRQARLRWYGHVMRRDKLYVGRKVMDMELPGKRRRGRPKRRYMDAVKEDMKVVGAKERDALDRAKWGRIIRCGNP